LTVGDTTKMYYWTGADWEELPIVNDVEAFKEQIAEELKDVPDREEFEATITENLPHQKQNLKRQTLYHYDQLQTAYQERFQVRCRQY